MRTKVNTPQAANPPQTRSQAMQAITTKLQNLYNTANDVNAWQFRDLEIALGELYRQHNALEVMQVGKALGLHGKYGKLQTIQKIRNMIGERRHTALRGWIIARAAKEKSTTSEEIYGVEVVE